MTPEQMQQFQQMMMGGGEPRGAGLSAEGPIRAHTSASARANSDSKRWITLYPIYFDAKRSNKSGERRVGWQKASLYPLSLGIVKAVDELSLRFAHEPYKTHPRDWENPGRVKVRLFDDEGNVVHSSIHNRKQLVDAVAPRLQRFCGGPPSVELPKRERAKSGARSAASLSNDIQSTVAVSTGAFKEKVASANRFAAAPPGRKRLSAGASARSSRVVRAKLLKLHLPPPQIRLPYNSPALPAGLLNMDLSTAMGDSERGPAGALPGGAAGNPMGALGSMMRNLGFGSENDDKEHGAESQAEAEKRRQNDPMRGMGRRGRKRVVRVGR